MKRQFTEEQIMPLLKQHEAGMAVATICREQNPPRFYGWRQEFEACW